MNHKHTYPSKYPPGTGWPTDASWEVLDELEPGVLSADQRALLGGMIAGQLIKERKRAVDIAKILGAEHVAQAILDGDNMPPPVTQ